MRKISGRFSAVARVMALMGMMLAAAIGGSAQGFKTLLSLSRTEDTPYLVSLVQGSDGNLYGTTWGGGTSTACTGGCGTVFKVTPAGTLTTLHSFSMSDGAYPVAGLVMGADGNFYGTTGEGGISNYGTIFKMTPTGAVTLLHSFDYADGNYPTAALTQGTDGNFYGSTTNGGASNEGTIFKVTSAGALTTLYTFCLQANCPDGAGPNGLVQGTDGDLYGTTGTGGANSFGTVFNVTPSGSLTTLHDFDGNDGGGPGGLIQASDGNFYGTTFIGLGNGDGTVFRITSEGALTTLYTFTGPYGGGPTGGTPYAPLIQATDGNFYGTTYYGGAYGFPNAHGTVFRITPAGTLTVLHSFDVTDGISPTAGLVQATNGNIYGSTSAYGSLGFGTIFGLSRGFGTFVKTVPASGRVGTTIRILGSNLMGATGVTFNGTAATFTVESGTAIKTTVPTGATTGPVQVVTPSGTLTSNVNFQIEP